MRKTDLESEWDQLRRSMRKTTAGSGVDAGADAMHDDPRDRTAAADCRPPAKDVLLSIVLPVFNEAEVLEPLLAEVASAAARTGAPFEIIFVNDGSTDGSGQLLDDLADDNPRLRVVHFSRNFGHQAAVQAGLQHARGDAVLLMDSDLQDSPQAIPRFFQKWQAGYDVVYAIRTNRKEGLLKRCLFAGFHRFLHRISTTEIPTDAGIFGLVDGRVAREIVALGDRDRYLPGLRSWVGFRQTGIVVERLARYDERPRVSMRGLWRLAKTAVFGFSSFPLTMFYAIGCGALTVFLGLAGYALFCKLFTSLAIPGWTSHVLSASFFGALNALGISMLGEYVIRIYDQVRGRPLYVVARRVNCPSGSTIGDELDLNSAALCEEAAALLESVQPRPNHHSDRPQLAELPK